MSSSDEALGQLMSMGIDIDTAQDALKKSNNDLQIALEYIYGDKSTNTTTTATTTDITNFNSSNNSNINVSHYEDVYIPDSQQLPPPGYSDVHEHNSNSIPHPANNHSEDYHRQGNNNADFTKAEVKPVDSFVSFQNGIDEENNNGDIGDVKLNRNVEINGGYDQSAIIHLDDDW
ncbi:unnamed protein product [[Candida] boidinii]|nr:unnamed protein product [[Candida] boidinii]